MRSRNLTYCSALGALLLLSASVEAGHGVPHQHAHDKRHQHQHLHRPVARSSMAETGTEMTEVANLERRGEKCQFPSDAGLVAITPGSKNAGWAMSPDQPCEPDSYCPYACPPGQLMAQWDPEATEYTYPKSQNGGLYCDKDGKIQKPFPDKPYCVDGTGSVGCKNKAKGNVAFCQTVLPGNEAMLIPTDVQDWAGLAVPDPSYWASTAAHYYINPPGTSTDEACVWGTNQHPIGNWSPYVAGANTDGSGQTFLKVGWNPIYLETATPFRDEVPTWGVKIECEGDGCNGLPCGIDPAKHKVNECTGGSKSGAGGANFCVVTVPKGTKANVVVFEAGNDGDDKGKKDDSSQPAPSSEAPSSTPPPPSSSESSTSTTSTESSSSSESSPTPTSSTSSESSSSSSSSTTTESSSSSTSAASTSSFSSAETAETTSTSSETSEASQTTSSKRVEYSPHIFIENVTSTDASASTTPSRTSTVSQQSAATSPTDSPQTQNAGCLNRIPALGASMTMMFLVVLTVAL